MNEEFTDEAGIYLIQSKITNDQYIGGTRSLEDRIIGHIRGVRHGNHANINIREYSSTYGAETLMFTVLEYCDPKHIVDRENYYLRTIRPSFNVRETASGCRPIAPKYSPYGDAGGLNITINIYDYSLREIENLIVAHTLEYYGWNARRTAKKLGVSSETIRKKRLLLKSC